MRSKNTLETLNLHNSNRALDKYKQQTGLRADEVYLIKEFFPPVGAKIIDLGVGSGRTTVPLSALGYDVVGIEFCDDLVEYANEKYPDVSIVQGDARQLDFPGESFDGALFSLNGIDYMYPVAERLQVMREVLRVVRPGGIFIVSSHNALGWIGRLFRSPLRLLRFWGDQVLSLPNAFKGYFYWRDKSLGMPLFYGARPSVQRRQLERSGWEVLAVRSVYRPSKKAQTIRDVHVMYVCRKPDAEDS